jgi:hypothetical protein
MTKNAKPRPRKMRLIGHDALFAKWRKDPAYRQARAEPADEFDLVAELIRARTAAGSTQQQVVECKPWAKRASRS